MLKKEKFKGSVWECCCGDGSISKVLTKHGYNVYSSDLINRGYGEAGVDFLKYDGKNYSNIITNPPYTKALEFILNAKKFANNKIAMFLRTSFLESQSRLNMFNDKEFPLKTVYQFSKRISLYKGGKEMKNSGKMAFCWMVWDKHYNGKPVIEWV